MFDCGKIRSDVLYSNCRSLIVNTGATILYVREMQIWRTHSFSLWCKQLWVAQAVENDENSTETRVNQVANADIALMDAVTCVKVYRCSRGVHYTMSARLHRLVGIWKSIYRSGSCSFPPCFY
ncbi:hypothetical protein Y032_0135g1909 [Ancylostoma ceylanicum]|nr:hypothetical protein Y032_0135g1909 [Ancylostoma ceylanicum]